MRDGTSSGAHTDGFWKRYLDKIGVGGTLFVALCCLGFLALVSIHCVDGLGFLINHDILRPLLIMFLPGIFLGLTLGIRHHRSPLALIVGILSAVTTYGFIYVSFNEVRAGLGIGGLVIRQLMKCVVLVLSALFLIPVNLLAWTNGQLLIWINLDGCRKRPRSRADCKEI
jgi:hypothetical protein